MKGGRIIVETEGHSHPLHYYIKHSMISVLSYDSAYGIILKLKYIGDPENCPYKSIEEHGESPLNQIILKLSMVIDLDEAKWKRESKNTLELLMKEKLANLEQEYADLGSYEQIREVETYRRLKKQYNNDLPNQLKKIDDMDMKKILYLIKVSDLRVDNHPIKKLVMSKPMFTSEVKQQFKLVKNTIQLYEPICPTVIYWGIKDLHSNTYRRLRQSISNKKSILEMIQENIDERGHDKLLITVLEWLKTATVTDKTNNKQIDYKIGIIGMELMDGYDTLRSYDVSDQDKMLMYVNFAAYELIRLGSLGYLHNDTHFNNILINPNVPYFRGDIPGRAMLIDFGRTTEADKELMSECQLVLETGDVDLMKSVLLRGVIYERQIDIYSHYIDVDTLRDLILSRNQIIEEHLQDEKYVQKSNKYISKYNWTTNRRVRSFKYLYGMKNAPLNRTRKASSSRRRKSLSPSPKEFNSSFGTPKSIQSKHPLQVNKWVL
jgi:hypothetical protein